MREVVYGPLVDDFGCRVAHCLEVVLNLLSYLLIRDLVGVSVLTECVSRDYLINSLLPSSVVDHEVAESLRDHVVEYIVGDLRVIFWLGQNSLYVVSLIVDLFEESHLVISCIEVLYHSLHSVCTCARDVERCGNDDLVILFDFAVYCYVNLAVLTLYLLDIAVQSCRVLELVVQAFPDVLSTLFPCPEVDLDEVHGCLEVEVLEDVACRDLVKVSVTECCERSDPYILDEVYLVLLAEFLERKSEVLEVRVDAAYRLSFRCYCKTFVTSLGNAAVTIYVISLVLGLEKFAELLELLLHPEKSRDLEDVLLRLERLNDLTVLVLVVTVELRAVMSDAAELFYIMYSVV